MRKMEIKNINDLRREIEVLTYKKEEQEQLLERKVKVFYEEFHPINMLTAALANIFERKTNATTLFKSALLYGVDVIVSNVWLKNSSENLKEMVSSIAQAFVAEFMTITGKFSLDSLFGKKHKEEKEEEEVLN